MYYEKLFFIKNIQHNTQIDIIKHSYSKGYLSINIRKNIYHFFDGMKNNTQQNAKTMRKIKKIKNNKRKISEPGEILKKMSKRNSVETHEGDTEKKFSVDKVIEMDQEGSGYKEESEDV